MEILKNFGFEPGLFFAQIVNFLILAYLFKRYLYKPILRVLRDREQKIKKGLEDAEASQKKLEDAENERDEILKVASSEAQKMLDETKKTAAELKIRFVNEAKLEAEKIVATAKSRAKIEIENMERYAKRISLDISSKILESTIKKIFTAEDKEKILAKSIETLKKYE